MFRGTAIIQVGIRNVACRRPTDTEIPHLIQAWIVRQVDIHRARMVTHMLCQAVVLAPRRRRPNQQMLAIRIALQHGGVTQEAIEVLVAPKDRADQSHLMVCRS
ncbi:MAG: hypothetical protein CRU78_04610 [Candidatus Accumulibacter phosphatis]|uniref:Uncharacterized protein n=1 Tax=Candidatus Accumulibacter phosphatis TaxID=327160 RepID=A0A6A7RQY1_9PROT|nr:hypothetical protein [Candidatus Accumulibacter phosphatis]